MKILSRAFNVALILTSTLVFSAEHPIPVITSTTDLAWAVKQIGGGHVEVNGLLKGTENPHYVDAIPEFIRLASEAKAAFVIGLDLEVGWMPKVLSRSGNAQIQPGGKGYCETGKAVQVLEKPQGGVDRSMGDVHPAGNPHFWLSPKHLGQAAQAISETLSTIDPVHAKDYQENLKTFLQKMEHIQFKNANKLKAALGTPTEPVLLEYHKEFSYFLETYGLKSLGSIEEKPGVAPSAGRLAEIALQGKGANLKFVLAADTAPKKTLERFSEISGIPVVVIPMSVQPFGKLSSYELLQEHIIEKIAQVFKTPATP